MSASERSLSEGASDHMILHNILTRDVVTVAVPPFRDRSTINPTDINHQLAPSRPLLYFESIEDR